MSEENRGQSASKQVAKDFAYIVENPSKEAEQTFQKILRWVRAGLPPAENGAFLSSRFGW